ncbi:MAG: sulfatase, partial [Planctomycetales bacterium]|nr:sulfatase [Planctomycetales bacterium]
MNRDQTAARRWFLQQCGVGLGGVALHTLLQRESLAAGNDGPLAPKAAHFPGKAKRVIYLFQAGAP